MFPPASKFGRIAMLARGSPLVRKSKEFSGISFSSDLALDKDLESHFPYIIFWSEHSNLPARLWGRKWVILKIWNNNLVCVFQMDSWMCGLYRESFVWIQGTGGSGVSTWVKRRYIVLTNNRSSRCGAERSLSKPFNTYFISYWHYQMKWWGLWELCHHRPWSFWIGVNGRWYNELFNVFFFFFYCVGSFIQRVWYKPRQI